MSLAKEYPDIITFRMEIEYLLAIILPRALSSFENLALMEESFLQITHCSTVGLTSVYFCCDDMETWYNVAILETQLRAVELKFFVVMGGKNTCPQCLCWGFMLLLWWHSRSHRHVTWCHIDWKSLGADVASLWSHSEKKPEALC